MRGRRRNDVDTRRRHERKHPLRERSGCGYGNRYRPGRAGRDQPAFFSPAFKVSVVMWIFTSSLTFGT